MPHLWVVVCAEVTFRSMCVTNPCACVCEPPQPAAERHIFERGCLRTGEEWLEANLVVVCGVAVSLAITQVTKLALCFFVFSSV